MPGTFTSISIYAYDHNERGDAIQAWETVAGSEADAIEEAKDAATSHAGVLVVRRDGKPSVGEKGDPIVVFRLGKTGDLDYMLPS
jgi:hypothetical protein